MALLLPLLQPLLISHALLLLYCTAYIRPTCCFLIALRLVTAVASLGCLLQALQALLLLQGTELSVRLFPHSFY